MMGASHKFVGTVWEYSQIACDALLPIFVGVCVFVRVRVCVPAVPLIRMAWLGTTPPTGACNDVYPRAAQSSKQQRQRTVANSNHRATNNNHSSSSSSSSSKQQPHSSKQQAQQTAAAAAANSNHRAANSNRSRQQTAAAAANSNHRAANSNHSRQRTAAAYSNHAPTIRLIGTHGACHLQPHRQLPRPIGTKSWGVFPGCVPDSDPDRANAD